jgi:ATPase family associated with various cellular activities (AAA)/BCS1 N terminal
MQKIVKFGSNVMDVQKWLKENAATLNLLNSSYSFAKNMFMKWFTVRLTVNSDQEHYFAINEFVSEIMLAKQSLRDFVLTTGPQKAKGTLRNADSYGNNNNNKDQGHQFRLTSGYSETYGRYKDCFITINRSLLKSANNESFREQLVITFFTFKPTIASEFLEEAANYAVAPTTTLMVSISDYDYWYDMTQIGKRHMDSIFIPSKIKKSVTHHLDTFLSTKSEYARRGQPYRTGILLSGKPGCGKTSLVHSIASHLNRNIAYLNLGSVENDIRLMTMINNRDWSKSILVLEDIDAMTKTVQKRSDPSVEQKTVELPSNVTLSTLLNVMDGIVSPPELVMIATTNHPERIDPAILRKSRFDLHVSLSEMEWPEFLEMAECYGHNMDILDKVKNYYVPMIPVDAKFLLVDNDSQQVTKQIKEMSKR